MLMICWLWACKSPTYQLFYADKENMYFVHPLTFKSKDHVLKADFTFRDNIKTEQQVKCNISLYKKEPQKITSIEFRSASDSILLNDVEKIFIEKEGKYFEIRYGGNMPFDTFSNLVKTGEFSIDLNNKESFSATGKTQNRLEEIQNDVMQVIYLAD